MCENEMLFDFYNTAHKSFYDPWALKIALKETILDNVLCPQLVIARGCMNVASGYHRKTYADTSASAQKRKKSMNLFPGLGSSKDDNTYLILCHFKF